MSNWRPSSFEDLAPDRSSGSFTRMHLVNLRDGSPYYPPPSNIITWEFPPGVHSVTREGMAITGSRLMLYTTSWGEELTNEAAVRWVVVWNWKTGEVVRLSWFSQAPPAHLVSSVTRPLVHSWERLVRTEYPDRLP